MQTLKEARERIARLRTDGLPWHIKLDVHDPYRGYVSPTQFKHDSGLEILILWRTFTLRLSVRPGEDVLDAARRAIHVVALHEVDEQLTVDGVRHWEPRLIDSDEDRAG